MIRHEKIFDLDAVKLTKSQRKVVDYILAHPRQAVFKSAAELGAAMGVSDATVVRVCQAMGYEGLTQFKERLRRELFASQDTVSRLENSVDGINGLEDLAMAVMRQDAENLNAAISRLSLEDFAGVARLLAENEEVAIIGLRSAHSLAHFLDSSLRFLGRRVQMLSPGIGYLWAEAKTLTPGSVLVAISFPRYTSLTVQVAQEAHQAGVKVVAMTDSPLSPLAKTADFLLCAPCRIGSFMESFVAGLSVLNALVTAVAYLDSEHSLDSLKELEKLWEQKGVYLRSDNGKPRG